MQSKPIAVSEIERDPEVEHFTTDRVFSSAFPAVHLPNISRLLTELKYAGHIGVSCVGIKVCSSGDDGEYDDLQHVIQKLHSAAPQCLMQSADLAVTLRPQGAKLSDVTLIRSLSTKYGFLLTKYPMCMTLPEMSAKKNTPVPFGSLRMHLNRSVEIRENEFAIVSICIYPNWVHIMRASDMHKQLRRNKVPETASGAASFKEALDNAAKRVADVVAAGADCSSFRLECRISHRLGANVFNLIAGSYDVFDDQIEDGITLKKLRNIIGFPLEVRMSSAEAVLQRAQHISTHITKYRVISTSKKKQRSATTWRTALCAYLSALGVSNELVLSTNYGTQDWPDLLYRLRREKAMEQKKPPQVGRELSAETERERRKRKVREIKQKVHFVKKNGVFSFLNANGTYAKGDMSGKKRRHVAEKILHKFGHSWATRVHLKVVSQVCS